MAFAHAAIVVLMTLSMVILSYAIAGAPYEHSFPPRSTEGMPKLGVSLLRVIILTYYIDLLLNGVGETFEALVVLGWPINWNIDLHEFSPSRSSSES